MIGFSEEEEGEEETDEVSFFQKNFFCTNGVLLKTPFDLVNIFQF